MFKGLVGCAYFWMAWPMAYISASVLCVQGQAPVASEPSISTAAHAHWFLWLLASVKMCRSFGVRRIFFVKYAALIFRLVSSFSLFIRLGMGATVIRLWSSGLIGFSSLEDWMGLNLSSRSRSCPDMVLLSLTSWLCLCAATMLSHVAYSPVF